MIYDSWNIRCIKQTFLSFWDIFCPFTPWQPRKSKCWEIKNIPGDIIILHMCTINDNHMCLVPEIWSTIDKFFVILDHFLPSYPTNNPKNKYFEKMKKKKKKTSRDIIMLQRCTINDNHMLYGSWDMERDRQNSLSFWTFFCPFTPLTTWKINFWKNEKNTCR